MQRLLVIGPRGADKSTLVLELSEKLEMALYHMNQLNWKPGWVESSKDEIRERLTRIIGH